MEFTLFEELASLERVKVYLLIGAAALFLALLLAVILYWRRTKAKQLPPAEGLTRTRALVYGAMSITLAFVLSYLKPVSLWMGGSVTILSMLPIFLYAASAGPKYGFVAAFAYALLQMLQEPIFVTPVQFALDYFVAFTCLGLASFFPRNLPLGAAVGGFCRMLASTISGAVFFKEYMPPEFTNPWVYSLLYNAATIGVDTLLCVIVAALPPIRRLTARVFGAKRA